MTDYDHFSHPLCSSGKRLSSNIYIHKFGDKNICIQVHRDLTADVWTKTKDKPLAYPDYARLDRTEAICLAHLLDKLSCNRNLGLELMLQFKLHLTMESTPSR